MALFFRPAGLYGQEHYYSKTFTTDNGLSHNSVLSIAQDTTGFLWIGTWDGLSRYDGYEFRNYYHDPEDSTSIPNFNIGEVKVDRHNNVWIFPITNMLARYDRASDRFRRVKLQSDSVLARTGIDDIAISPEGDLWIGGDGGIAIFDTSSQKFKAIRIYDQQGNVIEQLGADFLSFDHHGCIWISTNSNYIEGRLIQEPYKTTIQIERTYKIFSVDKIIVPNGFHLVHEFRRDADGEPWFLSNLGAQQPVNYSIDLEAHNTTQPKNLLQNSGTFSWYKVNHSIIVASGREKTVIALQPGEYPISVLMNEDNTIWYSTLTSSGMGTGLHRYDRTPDYFRHYIEETDGKTSVVYAILQNSKGELLVGTQGSNSIFCLKEKGSTTKFNELSRREANESRHPRSIIADSGGIWIGYMQYRLDYFNEKNNSISNVYRRTDPEFLNQPYGFRALLKDSRGNLLVGTEGLFLYTPSEKKPFGRIWRNIPGSRGVFCIKEDHEGTVWAGSSRKLIRLNHDYGVDSVFQISDIEYNVEDICFADSGKLWLALLGGGLELFDPQTGKREFYTTADGLSNNTTYSILEDRQKNLWISTDNGITRFNPFTHKFRIFGYTDGLRIHEFNSDAAFATSEGRMFFGGMGGVVAFHPDSIREDEARGNAAWLILTEFRVSGQPRYFNKAIYELKAVTLKKGDDNFGVSFACLDFKNADKIKYRYRLLGYDNAWTVISHLHRRINFAGLPPGKYALEVESTDINGSWTGKMALMITIPPFFYQTIGFMIVLGIFALGVIALFVMLNNRQIRMKEKQKQHHLKLESIRGQMNPHFIFNSLNSINYFIAKSDRLSANRYIANFSKLIRAFLINMSHEYVSLSDEIASLQDYLKLEFLRFGDKFDYLLNIEQVQETENWEVFPGMVQPFIENAIWHGVRGLQYRKGFITIRFILNPSGHLQCEVTDDGIGRKLAEQGKKVNGEKKSRGILLTLERMHIINHLEKRNYHILIQDLHPEKDECGTRVIIDIPSRKKISTHIFQNP